MPPDPSAPTPGVHAARRSLSLIFAVALLGRVCAAILVGDQFRFRDETVYMDAAARLIQGLGFAPDYSSAPAYPVFLALLELITPAGLVGVRVGQAVVAALGCVLCFELGRRLQGQLAGLAAAAIYALDPLLIVSSALLYAEAAALLVLSLCVVTTWEASRRDSQPLCVVSGVLLGLLAMLRPVGLVLVPVMMAWLLIGRRPGSGRRWVLALAVAGACLLTLTPWTVRNYRVYGAFVPIATSGLGGVPGIGGEVEQRGVTEAVLAVAERSPRRFARRTLNEFGHFWEPYPTRLLTDNPSVAARLTRENPRLATGPLVPPTWRDSASAVSFLLEVGLAIFGILLTWNSRRRETVWLLSIPLIFGLGYAVFFGKLRYRIPILPIVMTFAGIGAAGLGQALRRRLRIARPA